MNASSFTAHLDIHGFPECDYHVTLEFGSTPMNVVLDTGSANTAVISELCDCHNCSVVQKPFLPFQPQASQYPVNASYGNGKTHTSWSGFATGQRVRMGEHHAFARVDVITSHDNFFVSRCPQNQGLWGLAYPTLQTRPQQYPDNPTSKTSSDFSLDQTLFDAIGYQCGIPNAFTYQLCPKTAVDSNFVRGMQRIHGDLETENIKTCARAGHFWMGGYASRAIQSPITWVPLVRSHYFEVSIDHFMVNGKPVPMRAINHPRTIVDTGTNNIVLSTENLNHLLRALWHSKVIRFDSSIAPEHERSFWLDHAQLTIPSHAVEINSNASFMISISNNVIPIPLENIIMLNPADEGRVNISWTGLSHGGNNKMTATVLGNSLLRGKTTIWDRGGKRIGFADVDIEACCGVSTAKDVDVILSIREPSELPLDQRIDSTVKTVLIVLGTLTGVGLLLVLVLKWVRQKNSNAQKRGGKTEGTSPTQPASEETGVTTVATPKEPVLPMRLPS